MRDRQNSATSKPDNVTINDTGNCILYDIIGNVDYNAGMYSVTFYAGMTVTSFSIGIVNDNNFEGNETFAVEIPLTLKPNRVLRGKVHQASVIIMDIGKSLM